MTDTNPRDEAQRLALALGQGMLDALMRAANDGSLTRLASALAPIAAAAPSSAATMTPSRNRVIGGNTPIRNRVIGTAAAIHATPTLASIDESAPASLLPPLPVPVVRLGLSELPPEARLPDAPVLTELTKRFALIRALPAADGEEEHLAQDVFTGADAVVHVFSLDAGSDENYRRRLREHGDRLRRLEHAHLERIVAVGDHHGRPFVARGVVRGKRVSDLLAESAAIAEVDVLRLVEQASQGLHAASVAAGTTHGTLAPSCLLVEYAGIAVGMGVGDIEAVRVAGFLDPRTTRLAQDGEGIAYAAPEVIAGAPGDERSDIYALGAITCRLLTGSPIADPTKLAEVVSEPTCGLILTAMAARPEQRFLNHNGFSVACAKALRQLAGESPRSMRVLRKPMRLRARASGETASEPPAVDASEDTSTRLRRNLVRAVRERGITKEQARTPLPDDDVWTKDVSTRILRKHRNLKESGQIGVGADGSAESAGEAAGEPRLRTAALERRPATAAIARPEPKPPTARIGKVHDGSARIERLPMRTPPVIISQPRDRSIELLLFAIGLLLLILIYR